jgi:hypothetical protein
VLALGILVGLGLASYQVGIAAYAYSHPTSAIFSRKRRPLLLRILLRLPFLRRVIQEKEQQRLAYKMALRDAWKDHCANLGGRKVQGMDGQQKKGGPEKRTDPEDGELRTFEEMSILYKDHCTPQEMCEYWDHCAKANIVDLDGASPEESADLAQPPDWLDLAKQNDQSCLHRFLAKCGCLGCLYRKGDGSVAFARRTSSF